MGDRLSGSLMGPLGWLTGSGGDGHGLGVADGVWGQLTGVLGLLMGVSGWLMGCGEG